MNRSSHPRSLVGSLFLALVVPFLAILSLLAAGIVAVLDDPANPLVPGTAGPQRVVETAWERAQQAGVYRYSSDIVQTTKPLPMLANVGKSSRQDIFHLEGELNLPERRLHMNLWGDQGHVVTGKDGLEVVIEGNKARARVQGGAWEELDNFSDFFAPGGDALGYLAGARDIRYLGIETRAGITFARYGFSIDGPGFAAYMREELERTLREQGALPSRLRPELAESYRGMAGSGELWIDAEGLPLRLTIDVTFPEGYDEQTSAQITTTFSGFVKENILAYRWQHEGLAGFISAYLERHARSIQELSLQLALFCAVLSFAVLIVRYRDSRRLRGALALIAIVSMLISPLLQSRQTVAAAERLDALQTRQAQRQQEVMEAHEAKQSMQAQLNGPAWDPHRDPLATASAALQHGAAPALLLPGDESYTPELSSAAQATTPNPDSDEDGDGLTYSQELALGTSPIAVDSDNDGLTDDVEVRGVNGQDWFSDPQNPDTNNDGLSDGIECPQRLRSNETSLSPSTPCQDSDNNGTPDLFDADNDGDQVPDRIDVSPFNALGTQAPFNKSNPFKLVVNNAQANQPILVDIQLRPTTAAHLSYALNVLDWPSGDTQGQVRRVKDDTYASVAQQQGRAAGANDAYGDMRLIPLLEITIPFRDGHYGNLPVKPGAPSITSTTPLTDWLDLSKLQPYGISVQRKDNAGTLLVYVPLNIISDETGGGRVAFTGRMFYEQYGNSWGDAHQIRVVWAVHMLVDRCKPAPSDVGEEKREKWCEKYTNNWDTNIPQIVHVYDEDWVLAGLSVREDHGMDVAIAFENPDTDNNLSVDDRLWSLVYGLDASFVAGRMDSSGQRNMTIAEIARRFNSANNQDVSEEQRWGIPADALVVKTYDRSTFPTQDYLITIPMTHTRQILHEYFTDANGQPKSSPTLLFAREERGRSMNLDLRDSITISQVGTQTTVNVNLGPDEETFVALQWAPYRYGATGWEAYPIDEYLTKLEADLRWVISNDPNFYIPNTDPEAVLHGQVFAGLSYYAAMFSGVARLVQHGTAVFEQAKKSDADVRKTITSGGQSIGSGIRATIQLLVKSYKDFKSLHETIYGIYVHSFKEIVYSDTLKEAAQALWYDFMNAGSDIKTIFKVLSWTKVGIGVLKAITTLLFGSLKIAGASIPHEKLIIKSITLVLDVASLMITKASLAKDVFMLGWVGAFKEWAGKVNGWMAVVGWVIHAGGAVFLFAFTLIVNLISSGGQWTRELSRTVASTVADLIVTTLIIAISLIPGVGALITGILAIIDGIMSVICLALPKDVQESYLTQFLLCGGLTGIVKQALGQFFYDYRIMVALNDKERLKFKSFNVTLGDEEQGIAVSNTMTLDVVLTNTLGLIPPSERFWRQRYDTSMDPYTGVELRSSTFKYKIQPKRQDIHNELELNQIKDLWRMKDSSANPDGVDAPPHYITPKVSATAHLNRPGINQVIDDFHYLSEGYAVPALECVLWYCFIDTERKTNHLLVGSGLVFDIFPATLDHFYNSAPKDGGYTLAWDAFPRQKDFDGDGLTNKRDGGADPDDGSWNTDGDGLSDFFELRAGTDPLAGDPDNDGLNDAGELLADTGPHRADSDADGISDKEELDGWVFRYGFSADGQPLITRVTSDPIDADTDGDGISDGLEKRYGFNPRAATVEATLTLVSELRETNLPLLWLPFDEGAGATGFADISGQNHQAGCSGGSCPTAGTGGRFVNGLEFDGADDYLEIASGINLTNTSFTVALWAKPDSFTGTRTIVSYGIDDGDQQNDLSLRFVSATPTSFITCGFSSTTVQAPVNQESLVGTWHHIACSYDAQAGRLAIYLDSVKIGEAPAGAGYPVQGKLRVGAPLGNAQYGFDGVMDDLVIFGQALNADDIETLANDQLPAGDRIVKPGDRISYKGTLRNSTNSYAQGVFRTEFPDTVSGSADPQPFVLQPLEQTTINADLQIKTTTGSGQIELAQSAGGLITNLADANGNAALLFSFNEPAGSTTFQDDSGGFRRNNATCTAPACPVAGEPGIHGRALGFDGVDDRLLVAKTQSLKLTTLTLAVWFKAPTDVSMPRPIVSDGLGYALLLEQNTGKLIFDFSSTNEGMYFDWPMSFETAVNDNYWHHAVVVRDDMTKQVFLYLDGRLRKTYSYKGIPYTPDTDVLIGHSGGSFAFKGLIDEFAIYPRVLDSATIEDLYNRPALRLPLDYENRQISYDNFGWISVPRYARFTGDTPSDPWGDCFFPYCPDLIEHGVRRAAAQFNGSSAIKVQPHDSLDLSGGKFTISTWIYPTSETAQGILGYERGKANAYPSLEMVGRTLRFGFGDGAVWHAKEFPDVLTLHVWNHLVLSFDNGTVTLYVNGAERGVYTFPATKPANTREFFVGRSGMCATLWLQHLYVHWQQDENWFFENNSEFHLEYAQDGSAWTEIWKNYDAPSNQGYPFGHRYDVCQQFDLKLWEEDNFWWGDLTGNAANDIIGQYTLTSNTPGWPMENFGDHEAPTHGWLIRFDDGPNRVSIQSAFDNPSAPFQGLIDEVEIYRRVLSPQEVTTLYQRPSLALHLPLDEATGSTVFRDTTQQHTTICTGATCPTPGVLGLNNQAALFDGVDDYLDITIDVSETGYGLSLWFKADADNRGIFSVDDGTLGSNGHDRHIYLQNGNICARIWNDEVICTSGINYADGRWHHLVHTYASVFGYGSQQLYLDGTLRASGMKGNSDFTWQTGINIGFSNGAQVPYFKGLIDDVQIRNWLISEQEVQQLYRRAPKVLLRFDEAVGATQFSDAHSEQPESSASCNGAACPQAGIKGQIGRSLTFDGVDDVVQRSIATTALDNITLSAWVRWDGTLGHDQPLVYNGYPYVSGYGIFMDATGKLFILVGGNGDASIIETNQRLLSNQWQHVAIVREQGTWKFYLNGRSIPLPTNPTPQPLREAYDKLLVGGNPWRSREYFAGRIDEVAAYEHALSATEIKAIFDLQYGWVEDRQSIKLTVDADAPTSTLSSDRNYWPDRDSVLLVDANDPTTGVAYVAIQIDDGSWMRAPACGDADPGAAWCPTFDPRSLGGEGRYTLRARATDLAGNSEQPRSYTLLVDATAPEVSTTLPSGSFLRPVPDPNNPSGWVVPLAGTVHDPVLRSGDAGSGVVSVQVVLLNEDGTPAGQGAQSATITGGSWSVDYPFLEAEPSGSYTLRVIATDAVGNQSSSDLLTLRLDGMPPHPELDTTAVPTTPFSSTTLLSGVVGEAPALSGAVVQLHLEENAGATSFRDSSPRRYNGSCSGSACPSAAQEGRFGRAAFFDGLDDTITLSSTQILDQITLAAWIKPEASDGLRNILVQGYTLDPNAENFLRINSGYYEVGSWDGVAHYVRYAIPAGDIDQWVHLAGVYDGSAWHLYRNGVLVGTVEDATGAVAVNAPWAIGAHSSGTERFFKGLIDEPIIFDRALSAEEVRALAQWPVAGVQQVEIGFTPIGHGEPLFNEPVLADQVLHLPMEDRVDQHGNLTFKDISPSGLLGHCTGNACPAVSLSGHAGNAVQFDGVDDVVSLGPDLRLSDNFTLAAWLYPTGTGSNPAGVGGIIFNKEGEYSLARFGDGTIQWAIADASNYQAWVNTGAVAPLQQWSHVALTYSGGTVRTYLNGVLVHTASISGPVGEADPTRNDLHIGGRAIANQFFAGRIDEVRIISRSLAANEVAGLYIGSGPLLVLDLDENYAVDGTVFSDRSGWQRDATLFTDSDSPFDNLFYGLLLRLSMDDLAQADGSVSFSDASVNGYTGHCSGVECPVVGGLGRMVRAAQFDGVDDVVSLGPELRLSDNFTLAAWLYPTGTGSNPAGVGGIIFNKEGEYSLARFGDGTIQWAIADASNYQAWVNTGAVAPLQQWSHVALTYSGGTVRTYLNGVLVHTASISGPVGEADPTRNDLHIGGRAIANQFFAGRIDEVNMFDRSLSPIEIVRLYNAPNSVVNHSVPGQVGAFALQFDGNDDYLSVPGFQLPQDGPATFAGWFKVASDGQILRQWGPSYNGGFAMRVQGGKLVCLVQDNTSADLYPHILVSSDIDVADDRWHHGACVYENSLLRVIVDGVERGRVATGAVDLAPDNPQSDPLTFGGTFFSTADNIAGAIDDVQIYPRALTMAELAALAANGWQPVTAGQSGAGIAMTTWSASAPANLEGFYEIELRGRDAFDNLSTREQKQWSAAIDTLAPRLTLTRTYLGDGETARTRYTLVAQDFNLVEELIAIQPACSLQITERQYYQSSWYLALIGASSSDRLFQISASCEVPGHQTATVTASACDAAGNCATTAPETALSLARSVKQASATISLDAAIFSPAHGTVLTSTTPVTISGAALALASLQALTVTVDSTPIYTQTWANGALTSTLWSATWTPAGEGPHTVQAIVADWTGALFATESITLVLDTQAPVLSIASSVLTTTHAATNGFFSITGSITDAGHIASLHVSVDHGAPMDASVEGQRWTALWPATHLPDGQFLSITVSAVDGAGYTTQVTGTLFADLVPPQPISMTISAGGAVLAPGATLTTTRDLQLSWTAGSGGNGLSGYLAGWSVQSSITSTVTTTLSAYSPTDPLVSNLTAGEAQKLTANVISHDNAGNEMRQTVGPIYVDSPLTPDYISLQEGGAIYRGWMQSGCSLLGVDRRVYDRASSVTSRGQPQSFYTTWNEQALRFAWTGADWDHDGDLFIYLDTQAGGSTRLYNPYSATISNTIILLPAHQQPSTPLSAQPLSRAQISRTLANPQAETVDQMAADYLIWVQDRQTATLLHWEAGSNDWQPVQNGLIYHFDDQSVAVPQTDLLVPFAALNISNPAASSLSLVAVASEEQALRLWATMPARNSINSERVLDVLPGGSVHRFALTHRYEWTSLDSGLCPNGTENATTQQSLALAQSSTASQGSDADLELSLAADPTGISYSVLEENLFFLMEELEQFEGLADWDAITSELCQQTPDDPSCQRDATTDGMDVDSEETLGTLRDIDHPALGDGQPITYTLRYTNRGTGVSQGLVADMITWGPVRLPGGTYGTDEFGEYDNLILQLGDLAPGQTMTATFQGLTDFSFDPNNNAGWATIDVILYDSTGSIYNNQLEWFYLDHEIDDRGPSHIEILEPVGVVRPGTVAVQGLVRDQSPVPIITLQAEDPGGQMQTVTCPDSTPEDGVWSCVWNTGLAQEGEEFILRARATDVHGQQSDWSAWQSLIVDTQPPTITLDAATTAALADGVLTANEALLSGTIADNRLVSAVEVCEIGQDDQHCATTPATVDQQTLPQTSFVYDDVPSLPVPITAANDCTNGSPIIRTFKVPDAFWVADVDVGLSIEHTFRYDLIVSLISPVGTQVDILWNGTDAENYGVLLNDAAQTRNVDDEEDHNLAAPTYEHERQPDDPLNIFNNEEATGDWLLMICDDFPQEDDGAYLQSRLILRAATPPAQTHGTWQHMLTDLAADGETRTLSLAGLDSVGNRATQPVSYTLLVDTVAPKITVTTVLTEVQLFFDPLTVLSGTISDGGGIAELLAVVTDPTGNTIQASATQGTEDQWWFDLPSTRPGQYTIRLYAIDNAGNSQQAGPFIVTVSKGHRLFLPLLTKQMIFSGSSGTAALPSAAPLPEGSATQRRATPEALSSTPGLQPRAAGDQPTVDSPARRMTPD